MLNDFILKYIVKYINDCFLIIYRQLLQIYIDSSSYNVKSYYNKHLSYFCNKLLIKEKFKITLNHSHEKQIYWYIIYFFIELM